MPEFALVKPERVFSYFEEICSVPRGSGNMEKISRYCVEFAKKQNLEYYTDSYGNVVIYKKGTAGYEDSEPVILQGHLDMVCQKTDDCEIDFENDGLDVYVDGDYLKAKGTTLGADNGIAISMILAVLESNNISHPPIEAVFTIDEEIGLIGANVLDKSVLKSKRMINLDAEEDDTLTVSCAGGNDFSVRIPVERVKAQGKAVKISLKGLQGGHSGVEIDKGRVNANNLMGRLLNHLKFNMDFEIVSVDGGDKTNAITNSCKAQLCCENGETLRAEAEKYLEIVKNELSAREPGFRYEITVSEACEQEVMNSEVRDGLVYFLACVPEGIIRMSAEIEGLVETSQNLGILKTDENEVVIKFAQRSNLMSGMDFLKEMMTRFSQCVPCVAESSGFYPPWEFLRDSKLQELYKNCYEAYYGEKPKVEAIHAGLECSVFSAAIEGLDCIAIGPEMHGVHTVNEKLSVSSTENTFRLLISILKRLK
ncbi:MAG: aminoacyl-histidine dipeptidase [Ruminococcus sp.]|nr:aminoacyl-histidine dipeptidase [Ruminococcus sp.]